MRDHLPACTLAVFRIGIRLPYTVVQSTRTSSGKFRINIGTDNVQRHGATVTAEFDAYILVAYRSKLTNFLRLLLILTALRYCYPAFLVT